MKRTLVAALAVVVGGLALTPVAAQLANAEPSVDGGVFVPVQPARLYDWVSDPAKRATPTAPKTFKATGVAGIPATGVSAVVVDISAYSSTGHTNVYIKQNATDTTASVLSVGEDSSVMSNTTIVRPSSTGTITVAVNDQPIGFNVDVQGYFTTSSVSGQAGGFVPITPTRVMGTNNGIGWSDAPLNAGVTYTKQVTGTAGIPANATAIFANVRVLNATNDGALKIAAAGTNLTSLVTMGNFEAAKYNDFGMSIKLGTGTNAGKIAMMVSPGTADLIIDVQGYFTGTGEDGGGFTPLNSRHFFDSRTMGGAIAPNATRVVQVAGLTGIPDTGFADSVAMTIAAREYTASGSVSVYNADETPNGTSNIAFKAPWASMEEKSTAIVKLSEDGEVKITNNTSGTVHILLAVQGYFTAPEKAHAVAEAEEIDPATLDLTASDYQEPLSDVGTTAEVGDAKARLVALLAADAAIGELPTTETINLRKIRIHKMTSPDINSGGGGGSTPPSAVEQTVDTVWDGEQADEQAEEWTAGLEAIADDPTYLPYDDSRFTVEAWQGVQITDTTAFALVLGHYDYHDAAGWAADPTEQWQVTLTRELDANGNYTPWKLSEVIAVTQDEGTN